MSRRTRSKPAPPKTATKSAVLYCRVSTEEQAREGISLEAQEAALRSYCELQDIEVAAVVLDPGVSASKPLSKREGGARVLAMMHAGEADAVVAYKLDRLFRDASDCLRVTKIWDKAGASLHLLDLGGQPLDTGSAMGRFFLTVMAGAAEMERNQIRERTCAALAYKRSKGEKTGGDAPYGWRLSSDGRTLELHPQEQVMVRQARELRASGLSLRKVGGELVRRGLLPRRGPKWHPESVKSLLLAEVA